MLKSFARSLALLSFVFIGMQTVQATEIQKFSQSAFETAQKSGKPILVEIHADWCPTCKAQKPVINQLKAESKFKNLVIFDVDFDAQKDVVKTFNARMQSTLIVFKGTAETGRSVGDTQKPTIEKLLDTSL